MSILPGLQLSAPTEVSRPTVHELQKGSEWRFEVGFSNNVNVKVLSGNAELFGTELAPNHTYTFTGTKAAIYTWHGCRIEVTGECQVEYTAEETPMVSYANAHFALENMRQQAVMNDKEGPRVMVVGPENAGKTSLVKVLTGYATKSGRQPIVVNLDPREGMLSIPGSLSASTFSSIIDVEEGWGSSPVSGPSPIPVKLPLVYYYGLPSPEDDPDLYKPIVSRMALAVAGRLGEDQEIMESGCIIDTPGVISQGKQSYDLIQHIVSEFSVNVILVLGSERLYSDLNRRFDKQRTSANDLISVVKLAKSGGCVDRDDTFMAQARHAQIREYFFGDVRRTLSPHTQQVDYHHMFVFKIFRPDATLNSLLPGGSDDEPKVHQIFEEMQATPDMQHAILAIMHADINDSQENIRDSTVLGFVYVADVDENWKKARILAPVTGKLPANALIWGTWPEAVPSLV